MNTAMDPAKLAVIVIGSGFDDYPWWQVTSDVDLANPPADWEATLYYDDPDGDPDRDAMREREATAAVVQEVVELVAAGLTNASEGLADTAASMLADLDAVDLDAADVDHLMQIAAMGRIVYG